MTCFLNTLYQELPLAGWQHAAVRYPVGIKGEGFYVLVRSAVL